MKWFGWTATALTSVWIVACGAPKSADQPNGLSIIAKPAFLDLGVIGSLSRTDAIITLFNEGDSTVSLTAARATCGCTVLSPGETTIYPGSFIEVPVHYDPYGTQGRQTQFITLLFEESPIPLIVPLEADVQDHILVDPQVISLEVFSPDAPAEASVSFKSVSGERLEIVGVETAPHIAYEIVDLDPRDGEVALRFFTIPEVLKQSPSVRIAGTTTIRTNSRHHPRLVLDTFTTTRSPLVFDPGVLIVHTDSSGAPSETSLHIARRDGRPFRIAEVSSELPDGLIVLDPQEAVSHVITLSLPADGSLPASFTLQVHAVSEEDGFEQSVSIPGVVLRAAPIKPTPDRRR